MRVFFTVINEPDIGPIQLPAEGISSLCIPKAGDEMTVSGGKFIVDHILTRKLTGDVAIFAIRKR